MGFRRYFSTSLRNFTPKFVAMLLEKGGFNHVILCFVFLLMFALTLVTFEFSSNSSLWL